MGQLRIANCSCGSYAKNNRAPKSSWPGQIWAAVLPGPGTTNKVKEVMGVGGGEPFFAAVIPRAIGNPNINIG